MVEQNKIETVHLDIQVSSDTYRILKKICELSHKDLRYLLTDVLTQYANDNLALIERLKHGYEVMAEENKKMCENCHHIDEEILVKYLYKDD